MIVHTLVGAETPIKADALEAKWVNVRIEESLLETGPWATLDTQVLDPLPQDPSVAARFNLTFLSINAVAWYRLVWIDSNTNESVPTTPVYDDGTPSTEYPWLPTVGEVALHVRARTRTRGGAQVGTFTAETAITSTEVQNLIVQAAERMGGKLGTVPENLYDAASSTAAIMAAMFLELSYFPEQINSDRSSYRELKKLLDEDLTSLIEAMGSGGSTAIDDQEAAAAAANGQSPYFYFEGFAVGNVLW